MGMKPRADAAPATTAPATTAPATAAALRAYALSLPGAFEDYPWGERVAKAGRKVFAFFGRDDGPAFGFSVKLPDSGEGVLSLPFAAPTGYGLGKSGWVSVTCTPDLAIPLELMQRWVEESYRAIAPKRLAAQLPARAG